LASRAQAVEVITTNSTLSTQQTKQALDLGSFKKHLQQKKKKKKFLIHISSIILKKLIKAQLHPQISLLND